MAAYVWYESWKFPVHQDPHHAFTCFTVPASGADPHTADLSRADRGAANATKANNVGTGERPCQDESQQNTTARKESAKRMALSGGGSTLY